MKLIVDKPYLHKLESNCGNILVKIDYLTQERTTGKHCSLCSITFLVFTDVAIFTS